MLDSKMVYMQNTLFQNDQQVQQNDQDLKLVDQTTFHQHHKATEPRYHNSIAKSNKTSTYLLLFSIGLIFTIGFIFFSSLLWDKNTEKSEQVNEISSSKDPKQLQIKSSWTQTASKSKINEENEEDNFQLSFVETQFQGKQTEQSLTASSLAAMQSQYHFKRDENDEQRVKLLEDISILEVMIPDRSVPNYVAPNFYFFSVSIHDMILNSELQKMYQKGQTIFKITMKQHMRAIIRTQLVHNINFKGQIKPELSPFDKSIEEKARALKEIMSDEQIYYESLYEISKYKDHQLRFCIVVPSYNNVKSRLYLRNLDSIFMQNYQNYHVVYIDDASKDRTGEFVRQYVEQKKIPVQKIQVFINSINKKALYNIYNGIHSYCPDGQIVGLIDGDDSLLGRQVLQLYNAVYQNKKTALIYSNFLKILTNNRTSFGFGTQISRADFVTGKMRTDMSLVGTHFMTFYSDIFKRIRKEDLCYENGTFFDYAYDRAIITPMIEMAFPRVEYVPQITYEYRNDTGINDGTADWQRVSKIILSKPAYKQLQEFPFIDNLQKPKKQLATKNEKSSIGKQNEIQNRKSQKLQKAKPKEPKIKYFKDDDDQEEDDS